MNPECLPPNRIEIMYLNKLGFAQMSENSWEFFKLGYVFDFSATNLGFVCNIFENKEVSPICKSIFYWVEEQNYWNK